MKKDMRYIIMCGGRYRQWETPRHMTKVNGEEIVARTIRLLRENSVEDIAISSGNDIFKKFGVPVLKHENTYDAEGPNRTAGHWVRKKFPRIKKLKNGQIISGIKEQSPMKFSNKKAGRLRKIVPQEFISELLFTF